VTATPRIMLVNSAVAFMIALPLMITAHEFGHALAGVAQGLQPTVYPNQVTYRIEGTSAQRVITALAGPVVSLLIGVLVLAVVPAGRGFGTLFLLWFGALNVQEFTGYLMTAPFFSIGDIGAALHLLDAPTWSYWLVLVIGALGTVALGRHFTSRLLALTEPEAGGRSAQLRSLGLFAWLLGAALSLGYGFATSLLLAGGHDLLTPLALIETLATLTSGIFVLAVRFFMGAGVQGRGVSLGRSWPAIGAVIFLAVNVGRTLLLGPGLRL
jgi:hypothetical protein